MLRPVFVAVVVLAGLLVGARTYAHHSFAATYNEAQMIMLEGDLVQFLWRNPHSFVHIIADNEQGEKQRWAVEWGGGGQLARLGVARDSLKIGDHLIITGNPSRTDGDYRLRLRTIYRPADEWRWGGEFD